MKIAFFSDIHGNMPALEIAIKDAGVVDGFIVLGDVVNYGPWSNECVALLDSLQNCNLIKGNQEDCFIQGKYDGDNWLVSEFFKTCFPFFREFSTIKGYKSKLVFDGNVCKHTLFEKYIFEDTKVELDNNHIIGHSHRQYKVQHNGYILINPGSVGQNRQYINEINYMIYDTSAQTPYFRSILYDVDVVIDKMSKMKYPEICLDYYRRKQRK